MYRSCGSGVLYGLEDRNQTVDKPLLEVLIDSVALAHTAGCQHVLASFFTPRQRLDPPEFLVFHLRLQMGSYFFGF
ncbi:hypothetical protein VN12_12315 [Pirellula sp. SH-Sr6A]|nr:hypothetical protein VN12_12315 [Pirellula sp. SH-Sr6A]